MWPIKTLFAHYKAWFLHILAPLGGPWAIFLVCLVDSTAEAVPMDILFAGYCYQRPERLLLYSVLGAIGGAIGSLIPYAIGYKGGEPLLAKRIGAERFAKIHNNTEKYGDLALIVPAFLPPPTPFKLFVFSAGVARMGIIHFFVAIFTGRLIRFLILGGLTVVFGPEIVEVMKSLFKTHAHATLATLGALVLIGLLWFFRKKLRKKPEPEEVATPAV